LFWHPEYYTFVGNAKQQAGHKDHYRLDAHVIVQHARIYMWLYCLFVVHISYGAVSRLFVGELKN
jgi:hypothetical protein